MKRLFLILCLLALALPAQAFNYKLLDDYTGPSYNFRDEFNVPLPAGSVNGTPSTSGHLRTVVDTENKLSITGGNLSFAGGKAAPANGDPGIYWPSTARTSGLLGIWNFNITDVTSVIEFGFDSSTGGTISGSSVRITADTLKPYPDAVAGPSLFIPADATAYNLAIAQLATGAFYLLKGGTFTNWSLLWVGRTSTATPLYPSISNYSAAGTMSFTRVPSRRWLPTPLLSHGFASVTTPTDGAGHAETTGLGSGGSGVTMTGATWSISGGKAVNTPVTFPGGELLTDGGMENWASATDLTSWTETLEGTTTINREGTIKHSGNYSERLDVDASNSNSYVYQFSPTAGKYYLIDYWGYASASGKTFRISMGTNNGVTRDPGASWTNYKDVFRASSTIALKLQKYSAASASLYFDDVSVKELTLSELFLTAPLSTSNVVASADLTITAGNPAGIGLRLNDQTTPTKGLVAYHDGTYCKLDEFTTATTWTNRISAAATYSAGAKLVVITDGTSARLYYNNVLIGTTAAIDAGITGTIHGLFSTSSSNSIDNLVIYPRGTEGQFESPLNQFIQ